MLRAFSSRLAGCLKQGPARAFNTAAFRYSACAPSAHSVGLPSVRHGRDGYRHILQAEPKSYSTATPSLITDAHKSLLAQRRFKESNATAQTFHIAGVSFENRQEHVQRLDSQTPVMLIREPWNAYDPKAVAVYTVSGVSLGYVPKETTRQHRYEWSSAAIVSTGNATPDLLGVLVSSRPSLRSVCVQTLPTKHAAKYANLASLYPVSVWREMRERAIDNADHMCEVTGISAEETQLEVVPSWRYNDAAREVQLAGLMVVCSDVRKAAESISPGKPVAIAGTDEQMGRMTKAEELHFEEQLLLMDLLIWNEEDIADYAKFLTARQAKMDEEDWGVVLEVAQVDEDME